jgi:hypothetical protein
MPAVPASTLGSELFFKGARPGEDSGESSEGNSESSGSSGGGSSLSIEAEIGLGALGAIVGCVVLWRIYKVCKLWHARWRARVARKTAAAAAATATVTGEDNLSMAAANALRVSDSDDVKDTVNPPVELTQQVS